jgi:gliding motility-associated-like protein
LNDTTDIASLFMNFEHSFMGDLVITLICPNNQTLTLHQQSGGGTDLGEPVQAVDPAQPGVGYDYWFSPTSTSGTWVTAGSTLTTLPSGTYQSVQSWTQLIGCPLNGTWTLQICDVWGGDDGNLFEWGLNFNPQLYGDTLSFQPIYGSGCDSTYWTGPGIASMSTGCDFANVVLGNAGNYDFTYTAINDFGCSFDTTITITVDTAPLVSAGEDLSFDCTGGPVTLDGGFLNIPDADCSDDAGTFNYTYTDNDLLTWTFCPNNEYTIMSFEFVSGQMESFFEHFMVYDGANTSAPVLLDWTGGDLTGQGWTATNASGCLTITFDSDGIVSASTGDFDPWQYIVSCQQRAPDFVWHWTPSLPLSDASIQDPIVTSLAQTSDFVLTGYPVGQPGCFSTDTVTVTVPVDIVFDLDDFYQRCFEDTAALFPIGLTGGVAPYTFLWTKSGVAASAQDTINVVVTGAEDYCLEVRDACGTSLEKCAPILMYPEIPAGFSVDNYLGCAPHSVVLTSDYTAYQNVLQMIWRFEDGDSVTTMGSASHAYNVDNLYRPWLEIIDIHGCHYSDTLQNAINVYPSPAASFSPDPSLSFLPNTTFNFQNTSLGGGISQWVMNATDTLYGTDAIYTFPSETVGFYDVWLFESNEFGCRDSAERYVEVQNEMDIYVPNSFTPNNDGINDVWFVQGKGYSKLDYKMDVFDRWGESVFHSTDSEEVWTGSTHSGAYFVPDGIYHFRLEIRDTQHDVNYLREGHVLIVR